MFSGRIFQALRAEETQEFSVYDAFVRCAKEAVLGYSQQQLKELYCSVKNNGYIVHNELELCVYVTNVSNRHKEKFYALYRRLFELKTLSRHSSLAVWGCGCGLDLLALYDVAIRENNPELWLDVRNITLIDISPVALECAKDLAGKLFPDAQVTALHADLKDAGRLGELREQVLKTDAFLNCVHLLSNLLDLMNDNELCAFAAAVLSASFRYRRDGRRLLLDDTYVAFSPSYNAAKHKMEVFKSAICTGNVVGTEITDMEINNCAYCWFSAISNESRRYKELFAPLRFFFAELRGELAFARTSANTIEREKLCRLSNDFTKFVRRFGAEPLKDYDAVELDWMTINGRRNKPYIVLYPCDGSNRRILIAFSDNPDECKWSMIRNWADRRLSSEKCDVFPLLHDALNPLSQNGCKAKWRSREFFNYIEAVCLTAESEGWKRPRKDQEGGNLSDILFYKANPEIRSLPALSSSQNMITVDRKQLRKVRGGPGTGKSVTMLWRAVKTVARTHLPVVVLCKTNSLFAYSRQTLANTMLEKFGVSRVRRDLVEFSTVAGFICDQVGRDPAFSCGRREGMSAADKKRACARCKVEWCSCQDSKTAVSYGGVLVDEMQIQDFGEIKSVFDAVMRRSPDCDFYAFCDEQQTFRGSSVLERGVEGDRSDRLVVKMPAAGFGRYVTLKTGFRFMKAPKIRELCAFVQSQMSSKYDVAELQIRAVRGESNLISNQLSCQRVRDGDEIVDAAGKWMRGVFCGLANVPARCAFIFDSREQAVKFGDKKFCGMDETLLKGCGFKDVWVTHNSKTEQDNEFARRQRTKLFDRTGTFLCTTIDCAQGQTFSNVILVMASARNGDWETLFTGISRAAERLLILDVTSTGWIQSAVAIFGRNRNGQTSAME